MHNNPYSNASDAYNKVKTEGGDQRAMEGNALLKAARRLQQVRDNWEERGPNDLEEALIYNRKLWTVFAGETTNDEHPLPLQLKNNIANLSIFIFKRTIQIQIDEKPDMLDALIDINRNIAAGLLAQPEKNNDGGNDPQQKSNQPSTTPQPHNTREPSASPTSEAGGITIDS